MGYGRGGLRHWGGHAGLRRKGDNGREISGRSPTPAGRAWHAATGTGTRSGGEELSRGLDEGTRRGPLEGRRGDLLKSGDTEGTPEVEGHWGEPLLTGTQRGPPETGRPPWAVTNQEGARGE